MNHNYPDPEKWVIDWISRRVFSEQSNSSRFLTALCFFLILFFLGRAFVKF